MCLIWCSSDEQSMLRSARSPLCLMTPTMRSVSNTLFLWLDYLQLFHTPVSAHALASGKAGNIPALAVDTVEGSSVYVRNVASFQDGRDAYSVKIVTFQDRQAALGKARQHLAVVSTGLHYPCSETVSGAVTVVWHCQFITYHIPAYMHVAGVTIQGRNLLLAVWFVARPVHIWVK